jgi:hypothetical protein
VLGLPVYDTQCGAKLFRRNSEAHAVFAQPFFTRWVFDVELLARLLEQHRRRGKDRLFPVCELPLHEWYDVGGSKLSFASSMRGFVDLVRIWLYRRRKHSTGVSVKTASAEIAHKPAR